MDRLEFGDYWVRLGSGNRYFCVAEVARVVAFIRFFEIWNYTIASLTAHNPMGNNRRTVPFTHIPPHFPLSTT